MRTADALRASRGAKIIPTLRRSFIRGACLLVIAIPVLAGCSSKDDSVPVAQATSASDAAERRLACLQDRGWTVTLSEDNAIAASVPSDQLPIYQQDAEECGEGLLPDKNEFSSEQWSEAYAAANDTVDCLAVLGYEVDNRPSLQKFIDDSGDWSVYADLLDQGIISGSEVSKLENSCPQAEYWG